MTDQLYQDRIVALAKAKTGAGKLASPTKSARRDNPLCGDRVTIDVKLDGDGRIAEIRHDAERAVGREAGEAHEPFAAFAPVRDHKSRQECVLLPFEALKDALS